MSWRGSELKVAAIILASTPYCAHIWMLIALDGRRCSSNQPQVLPTFPMGRMPHAVIIFVNPASSAHKWVISGGRAVEDLGASYSSPRSAASWGWSRHTDAPADRPEHLDRRVRQTAGRASGGMSNKSTAACNYRVIKGLCGMMRTTGGQNHSAGRHNRDTVRRRAG